MRIKTVGVFHITRLGRPGTYRTDAQIGYGQKPASRNLQPLPHFNSAIGAKLVELNDFIHGHRIQLGN